MSARGLKHRRGWSSGDAQPKVWEPVVVTAQPVFSGAEERQRYQDALASTPREPGEDPVAWVERVNAKAKAGASRQPGEEG